MKALRHSSSVLKENLGLYVCISYLEMQMTVFALFFHRFNCRFYAEKHQLTHIFLVTWRQLSKFNVIILFSYFQRLGADLKFSACWFLPGLQ